MFPGGGKFVQVKLFRFLFLSVAALVSLAGCRVTPSLPPADFHSACASAFQRRGLPRTVELLEQLAGRHAGRERQLARLNSATAEEFRGLTAENDPRFMWALEAECCVRMLLLPEPAQAGGMEARMEPVALRLLEFEQAVWWAKFAACRDNGPTDREREECLLALALTTGWEESRIVSFDFSTLPLPEGEMRTEEQAADVPDPGAAVIASAAELLRLSGSALVPELAGTKDKLAISRQARIALASRYLRDAERGWRENPSAATLSSWRIARARYLLESALPDL